MPMMTKENLLGVQRSTLEQFGAVSEQTVIEMAKGILQAIHSDYAIVTSGIMGPDGAVRKNP